MWTPAQINVSIIHLLFIHTNLHLEIWVELYYLHNAKEDTYIPTLIIEKNGTIHDIHTIYI